MGMASLCFPFHSDWMEWKTWGRGKT